MHISAISFSSSELTTSTFKTYLKIHATLNIFNSSQMFESFSGCNSTFCHHKQLLMFVTARTQQPSNHRQQPTYHSQLFYEVAHQSSKKIATTNLVTAQYLFPLQMHHLDFIKLSTMIKKQNIALQFTVSQHSREEFVW